MNKYVHENYPRLKRTFLYGAKRKYVTFTNTWKRLYYKIYYKIMKKKKMHAWTIIKKIFNYQKIIQCYKLIITIFIIFKKYKSKKDSLNIFF